jgi:hypothetical protein
MFGCKGEKPFFLTWDPPPYQTLIVLKSGDREQNSKLLNCS